MTNRSLRTLLAEAAAKLNENGPNHRIVTRLLDAESELYKRAEAGKGNMLDDERDPKREGGW